MYRIRGRSLFIRRTSGVQRRVELYTRTAGRGSGRPPKKQKAAAAAPKESARPVGVILFVFRGRREAMGGRRHRRRGEVGCAAAVATAAIAKKVTTRGRAWRTRLYHSVGRRRQRPRYNNNIIKTFNARLLLLLLFLLLY